MSSQTPISSTNTSTPPSTTANGTGSANGGRNNRSNGPRNQRGGSVTVQGTDSVSFEGACADVGAVMGLRTEKITKKVPFSVFQSKMADYVITTIRYGSDVERTLRYLEDPFEHFVERHKPSPLTMPAPTFDDKFMQQERIKAFVSRENMLRDNCTKVFGLVWRQCTSALQAVVKGEEGYKEKSSKHDLIWLLMKIKQVTSGVDVKANRHIVLLSSLLNLLNMRQQDNESNDHYVERFKANVHTVELARGGHIFCSHELLDLPEDQVPSEEQIQKEEEMFKAIILLARSDEKRYKKLLTDLKDGSHLGRDEYPKSVAACFDLMNRTSGQLERNDSNFSRSSRGTGSGGRGSSFAQASREEQGTCVPVAGSDGRSLPNITCYNCDTPGHYAGQCPEPDRREQGQQGSSSVTFGISMVQNESDRDIALIDENWILLDTCSTHCVGCNSDLISNIRNCTDEEMLTISTNGGSLVYDKIGTSNLMPVEMYYNPKSIANVLSLSVVAKIPGCRIIMDTDVSKTITVFMNDGSTSYKFEECSDGLYYYDTSVEHNEINNSVNDYFAITPINLFINSVDNNKKMFSKKQINRATAARKLQHVLGWPSTEQYKSYVNNNMLKNCSITVEDIVRAETIYGKPAPLLKGK